LKIQEWKCVCRIFVKLMCNALCIKCVGTQAILSNNLKLFVHQVWRCVTTKLQKTRAPIQIHFDKNTKVKVMAKHKFRAFLLWSMSLHASINFFFDKLPKNITITRASLFCKIRSDGNSRFRTTFVWKKYHSDPPWAPILGPLK
jgi:hypothetical protein